MDRFDVKTIKMLSYVPNHSKHSKTTKVIKLRWIASIWCQKHQTTQNYKSDQITMKCMDLTSKWTKMLSYVANHSKQLKPSKVFKLQWTASIWCQKHQTTQNYKSYQSTMKCMDLTSKRTKMLSYVANHSKQLKPSKVFKLQWTASIWCQKHQTTQNYKSDQITTKCMDLTSKRSKMFSYVQNHSKQLKPTKVIKLQWIASISCRKHQTTQNYKSDQITMKCMDLTSKRTKMLCYVGNHSKQRKSTKVIKVQWIASIWCQNDKKCWVTSQTIPNNAKLQKWSNYDELHRFDVKTIKNV